MGKVDILSASAGSGKTYTLSYAFIRKTIENPSLYRHILAVTFTNKATDEMKQRILHQLNALANGDNPQFEASLVADTGLAPKVIRTRATEVRNRILHDYDNFAVLTIDKFFQRIIRAFIKELGIDRNFNLELQTDTLLDRAADKLLEDLSTDETLRRWVMGFIDENIEEGASWNIKTSLVRLGGELFKEQYRRVKPSSDDKPKLALVAKESRERAVKAVAQYQAAAKEFCDVMDEYGLSATDFFGAGSSVAAFACKAAGGDLSSPNKKFDEAVDNDRWYAKTSERKAEIDMAAPRLRKILIRMKPLLEKAQCAENTASIIGRYYRDFALLSDLRRRIDDICSEEDILPISDVNGLISKLVSGNDTPFIYEKSGNRYSDFMIDEFQDTSAMQWNNFVPLLQNAVAQSDAAPVLLVGDVKQSIYRWRGGDWTLLSQRAAEQFAEAQRRPLVKNYRSRRRIVEFNNGLIDNLVGQIERSLGKTLAEAEEAGYLTEELRSRLAATVAEAYSDRIQEANDTAERGYVTVLQYGRDEEVHPVIKRIEELESRGYLPSDIAILVRRNQEAADIASVLLEYKSRNPDSPYRFDIITQEALALNSSNAVRFIMACLALTVNPADTISLALYNQYFGRSAETPLGDDEKEFLSSAALLPPEEAFEKIQLRFSPSDDRKEIPYIQALHSQIIDFCSRKIADTGLLLDWWKESGRKQSISLPQNAQAITVATIHKAKGLEFKAVIIPYCSWSLSPKSGSTVWSAYNDADEHDRNLFPVSYSSAMARSAFSHAYYVERTMSMVDSLNELYVAVTRAGEELHIMIPEGSNDGTVGGLVTNALPQLDFIEKRDSEYVFGSPEKVERAAALVLIDSNYPTFEPGEKIAVRFSHQRYTEEGGDYARLTPRDYGILMHRVFAEARNESDIEHAIELLTVNGDISPSEATQLRSNIEAAFANPVIAEWFGDSWDDVRNENEIIARGQTYRPDRVMISGRKVAVVDYKFGRKLDAKYENQLRRYVSLLGEMGYTDIKGYIWYIAANELTEINNQFT